MKKIIVDKWLPMLLSEWFCTPTYSLRPREYGQANRYASTCLLGFEERYREMRFIFCPDDVQDECYRLILPALAVADQVVVWRPSFSTIDRLHAIGRLEFSAMEFLSLVEAGHVVIGARHDWFSGQSGRQSVAHWNRSPWTNYDAALIQMQRNDESSLFVHRRVISLDPGKGEIWADQKLNDGYKHLDLASNMLRQSKIPFGILRKVSKATTEVDKLRILLTAARNIANVEGEVHADISFQPFDYIGEMATIGDKPSNIYLKKILRERASISHCVEMTRRINRFENFADWKGFLDSNDRKLFQRSFAPYLASTSSIEEFAEGLRGNIKNRSWGEAVSPNAWTLGNFMSSICLAAIGAPTTNVVSLLNLALSVVGLAPSISEKLNVTEISEAEKIRWMFLVRGKRKVTERQVGLLVDDLKSKAK